MQEKLKAAGLYDAKPNGVSSEFNRLVKAIQANPRLQLTKEIFRYPEQAHHGVRHAKALYFMQNQLIADQDAHACPFEQKKPFVIWCSGPPGKGKSLFAKLAAYDPDKWLRSASGAPLGTPAYDGPRVTAEDNYVVKRKESRSILDQVNPSIPSTSVTLAEGAFAPRSRKEKTHDKWFGGLTSSDRCLIIDEMNREMFGSPQLTCKVFFSLCNHGTYTGEIKGAHVNMELDLIIVTAPQTCKQMWETWLNDNPDYGQYEQFSRRINLEKSFGEGQGAAPRQIENAFNI
jgi:hypothetical protein